MSRFRTTASGGGHRSTPPTTRGRATLRAFEDAARRVFHEKGFLRCTVSDIARAAGKSPATFYTYFDSREDLLAHLADQVGHQVLARSGIPSMPGDAPQTWFQAAAGAYWDAWCDNQGVLVGVFQMAMVDDGFAERWRDIRQAGLTVIESSLRDARRIGTTDLDPATAASAITSMFENFCYVWLGRGGESGAEGHLDRGRAVETLASIWWGALHRTNPG